MDKRTFKLCRVTVAIICVTTLEAIALMKGIDGRFLIPVVAIISGLAGYEISINLPDFSENSKNLGE